jgi:2-methylcitrate dehydratase PrpD
VTSEPTLLEQLSAFAANVTYESLPAEVAASVKDRVLDTLGICLAAVPLDTSRMATELAAGWGGPEQATVIGFPLRLPARGAAFVNGVLAHSLDFDDTHLPSVLHPSACVIPTALAAGETVGASGEAVIAAAAAGYEVTIRTGMAAYDRTLGNSVFFEDGWHATSICGTLAAAVIAAKLYGMGARGIGNALGIAVSMGSGVIEGNRAGGSVKRLHCGWAAHAGIAAAQAARSGFTGPVSALEGRFGFYQAFCRGRFDPSQITLGLGTEWSIPGVFYKPYPANHFTHAAIDAALALRQSVNVDDIANIELRVASPTLRTIAEPAEAKARPLSGYHAQFSGPFVVATALLGGGGLGVSLDDFTDQRVSDPRYLELAAKVRCVADPECDAIFPNQFPAILRVRTRSGTVLEQKVLSNRGGPGNPLSVEELKLKFSTNAARSLEPGAASELAGMIGEMGKYSIEELMAPTARATGDRRPAASPA